MRKTIRAGANARGSSLLLGAACALALSPVAAVGKLASGSLSQAIIAYSFLRSNYADFDQLLAAGSTVAVARDMKVLQGALDSLSCDVPTRLAFPHKAFVVPSFPAGQWIQAERPTESVPQEGVLFATESLRAAPERVLVIVSSVAPERTTVFWLEEGKEGYASKLLYDSFNTGEISNAPHTMIGAVMAVSFEKSGDVLLKERAEPGSRPGHMGTVGRVFQVDLARGKVRLKAPGTLPQP